MSDYFPAQHYTVTVGTVGTTIQALIGATTNIGICKQIFLQADPANSGTVLIGGINSTVTTANWGIVIPIPLTNIPAAPLPFEASSGLMSPGELALKAANTTDKIHVFIVK